MNSQEYTKIRSAFDFEKGEPYPAQAASRRTKALSRLIAAAYGELAEDSNNRSHDDMDGPSVRRKRRTWSEKQANLLANPGR